MVDLYVLGLGLTVVSLLLAGICLATTVTTLRAEGMRLKHVPLFSFSVFSAAIVWLLSFPVLLANLAVFYVDHRHGGRLAFGTNDSLYPQIAWIFSPPQVFAIVVPCLGIIGEVLPTFARTRPRSHDGALAAVGLAAILSFGAAVQPFFAPGATDDAFYVLVGFAAIVPYLMLLGLWGLVLKPRKGEPRPRMDSPLQLALLGFLLLFGGVLAAAVRGIDVLDLVGTSWDAAVLGLVVFGGALVAFGGIAYWAPKLWGGRLGEPSGRISALLLFLGAIVLTVPDLWSGALDQPDVLQPDTTVRDGVEALNGVSAAGLALVALGVLVFLLGLLRAVKRGRDAGAADPWEGQTLEWATASPPARTNFTEELPAIESDRPLLDARTAGEES
jgi:heme/copper-type cytochrome/quinol oxidase subunit 1